MLAWTKDHTSRRTQMIWLGLGLKWWRDHTKLGLKKFRARGKELKPMTDSQRLLVWLQAFRKLQGHGVVFFLLRCDCLEMGPFASKVS